MQSSDWILLCLVIGNSSYRSGKCELLEEMPATDQEIMRAAWLISVLLVSHSFRQIDERMIVLRSPAARPISSWQGKSMDAWQCVIHKLDQSIREKRAFSRSWFVHGWCCCYRNSLSRTFGWARLRILHAERTLWLRDELSVQPSTIDKTGRYIAC